MTEATTRQALQDSVNEVLEKMFFVAALEESPAPEAAGAAPLDEIAVRLTFQGSPSGWLMLRLTSAAARQIAADFLGSDETDGSDLQTSEVVREMANMICGSLLSRVEAAAAFHLAEPRIVPPADEPAGSLWNTRYAAELSNGRLTVNVATETRPCPPPAQSAS